jgi:hypothetical protein
VTSTDVPLRPSTPAWSEALCTAPWRALTLVPRSVVTVSAAPRRKGLRDVVVGVLGVGLGVWAWFVAFLVVVGFARGPLYGLVVPGPYDDAWGGPSLWGAWVVHAAVWVGVGVAAVGMWWAVVALADRVAGHVRGERRARWAVPVAAVLLVAAAIFVWLWIRQI